jgi:hypothetical protein
MKKVAFLLLACLLLASCGAQPPTPPGKTATPAASATPADKFEVYAWVDKPTPAKDERVIISGSLKKNGVYLGGMAMTAIWPDSTLERGVPNCHVQVIYQRGICITEADKYPSGVYVPVTVKFEYRGGTYTAQTGFKPQ